MELQGLNGHAFRLTTFEAFDADLDEVTAPKQHHRDGGLGDIVLKTRLLDVLRARLASMRAALEGYAADPGQVMGIAEAGMARARVKTQAVLTRVRTAFHLM